MRLMNLMMTSSSDVFGLGPLLLWTVVIVFQYVTATNGNNTNNSNSTEWFSKSENVSTFLQNNVTLNNTFISTVKTFVSNESSVTSMDTDDNWLINVTNNYQEMGNDSYYESETEDDVNNDENTATEDDEPERVTSTYKSTTITTTTITTTAAATSDLSTTNIIKSTETTTSNVTIIKHNDSVVVGVSSTTPTLLLDTSTSYKVQVVATNSTTEDEISTRSESLSSSSSSSSSSPTTLKTTLAPPLEHWSLQVTTQTSSPPFVHKEVVNAEMVSPKVSQETRMDDRDDDDDDDDDDEDQEEENSGIPGQPIFSSSSSSQTHTMVYFDFRRQCPEEHAGDVWWNRTYGGVIAVRYCPGGYTGKVYRMCYYGGTWGDVDFSECRVQHLIKLKHLLYYHVHKNLTDGFHSLADELLSTLLRYRLRSVDDYVESLDSLNIIINARVPLDFDLGQDFKYLKAILKISDMLFSKFDNKWTFPQEQQDMVTMKLVQVLHGMTHFGNLVAEGIKKSSRSVVIYSDYAHIGLEAKVIRGDEDYRISPAATGSSVHLPARLYKIVGAHFGSKEKYVVVTMWYSGITSSLQEYDGHIDSAIFATTIHPGRDMHLLAGPVTMTLSITEKVNENDIAECGFLRRTFNRSSLWSRAGCTVSEVRSSSVTCICHHMTNIAVVIRPRHHEGHLPWRSVSVAVMIGCAISLVALILTFVSHVYVLRYQSSESSLIVLNLILAMMTAEIVFMEGIQATSNPEVCEGVSIVLHYVYLVSSFWLLSLGIHVYVSTRSDKDVVMVSSTPTTTGTTTGSGHMRDYCLLSWVLPIILVVITFAVNPRGYEIRKYCWLSIERGMLISYIVPIFCLITANTTLMVLVLKHLFETKVCMKKCDIDKTRTAVRASVILLPYHGVNWFFGVLAMEDRSTDIFQYIFAISTAVQGLLIFLFFAVLQSEVRKAFRHFTSKVLRRRKSSDLKLRRSRRKRSKVDAEPLLIVQENNETCSGIVHTHQGSNLVAQCLHGSEEPFILAEEQFPIT